MIYSDQSEPTGSQDKYIFIVSTIGMLTAAMFLISDNLYNSVFPSAASMRKSKLPAIGVVSVAENDIRLKNKGDIGWKKSMQNEPVRVGDSLFTGQNSRSQVALNDGGTVTLDQNSMVTFAKTDNIEMPNLSTGNFKLTVNGKMKVMIAGQVSEISGQGAEIQLTVDDKKQPVAKLLKGTADLVTNKKKIRMNNQKTVQIEKPVKAVVVEEPMQKMGEVSVVKDHSANALTEFVYYEKLSDIYENNQGLLNVKKERKRFVNLAAPVSWIAKGFVSQVYGSLADSPDFATTGDSFSVPASQQQAEFSKAYLGENYYRLSIDGKTWGPTQNFRVQTSTLRMAPPQLATNGREIYILEDKTQIEIRPYVEAGSFDNLIYEISNDNNFSEQNTKRILRNRDLFVIPVDQPRVLYVRVRGVDEQERLTDFSQTHQIQVFKPQLPTAPQLTKNRYEIFIDEELSLQWQAPVNASSYQVDILKDGKLLNSEAYQENSFQFRAVQTGVYQLQILSVDRFGRKSKNKWVGLVAVQDRPIEQAPLAQEERKPEPVQQEPEQKLTTVVAKQENKIPEYINRSYAQSRVYFEGIGLAGYSQDQIQQNQDSPTVLSMGLRLQHWLGIPNYMNNGFELAYRSKVSDVNDTKNTGFSPTQIEARYMYRWHLHANMFSDNKNSQIWWIMGYESYRNSGSKLFSPKYDLMKAGFGVAMPLANRWDGGGDVLYGFGADRSQKYEVSGYFSYYLQKKWSLGMGYRVHLFEAGSTATAPIATPYREGVGEGYSVLRWVY